MSHIVMHVSLVQCCKAETFRFTEVSPIKTRATFVPHNIQWNNFFANALLSLVKVTIFIFYAIVNTCIPYSGKLEGENFCGSVRSDHFTEKTTFAEC